VRPLSPAYVREYIGGRGLGARYLYDLLPPGVEPLAPGNVALLMTGPFTGTEAYACHKYEWVTKSPLTGTYLCSSCGGQLGVSLRRAGFDGLLLTGAAERPTCLFIAPEGPELRDAAELWGRSVYQTQELLRARAGPGIAVGCIGPAGEPPRSVRFAGFFDGQRSAGRGGLGAVLGSKQLKAIAIVPGAVQVPVCDRGALERLLPELARALRRDRIAGEAMAEVGTMLWIDTLALSGLLPARNYQTSLGYADVRGRLDSETYRTRFARPPGREEGSPPVSCHRCPLQSAKLCTPDRGRLRGVQVRGPEFQSAWALGVNCGLFDYQPIIAAYAACNDYGVDAISLGGTVGFAMECCQRGLIDAGRVARDYDGLRLEWGNCEAVLAMVAVIAERRGWLGELLADGVRAAAERLPESAAFALHVKGMEFPSYDPRGAWGMALAYATGCRGACHLKSWTLDAEYSAASPGPASSEGKAAMVIEAENMRAVIDSALVCTFASQVITEEWLVRLVQAVTGLDLAAVGIDACGARICGLERRLALRQGVSSRDDRLPDRILEEPLRGGSGEGTRIGRENFERMLAEYYALRGWDEEGRPPAR
jgi:aldehyde:ferredoxin oxidoreductase